MAIWESSFAQWILEYRFLAVPTISGLLVLFWLFSSLNGPLRRIPGSFWAKISFIPLVRQCRQVRRSEWVVEQHEKYGAVVRIAPNHVSISDPEAVAQIYGHKSGFLKGPFYEDIPQIHQRKRKYLNPAFSARNLQLFEQYMKPSILSLVGTMRRNKSLDFCRWSNFLAFDIIGEYSFGAPFGFVTSGNDNFNLIHTLDVRGEVFNALGHLPLWLRPWMKWFPDPFWYYGLRAPGAMVKIGQEAYEKRKGESSERKDLLSFLFHAKDPETGAPLDEAEIVAESISFIVGGSDTTSSTMTHFMDIVSRDPSLQSNLHAELLEAFPGPLDEDWIAPEDVAGKLPLLNAILKEVMRFRPTSSTGLERVTPSGGKTIAGTFIPAGTLVSVPTVTIHHNPKIYQSPQNFDPQRWLNPNASDLTDYFVPFSTGPRACVGRNFAWMEMSKTLATIFRLFEFERAISSPSCFREGFFVKITECEVRIRLRDDV